MQAVSTSRGSLRRAKLIYEALIDLNKFPAGPQGHRPGVRKLADAAPAADEKLTPQLALKSLDRSTYA